MTETSAAAITATALATALDVGTPDVSSFISHNDDGNLTIDSTALLASPIIQQRLTFSLAWNKVFGSLPPLPDNTWRSIASVDSFTTYLAGTVPTGLILQSTYKGQDLKALTGAAYTTGYDAVTRDAHAAYIKVLELKWGAFTMPATVSSVMSCFQAAVRNHLARPNATWADCMDAARHMNGLTNSTYRGPVLLKAIGAVALVIQHKVPTDQLKGIITACQKCNTSVVVFTDSELTIDDCKYPPNIWPVAAWRLFPRALLTSALELSVVSSKLRVARVCHLPDRDNDVIVSEIPFYTSDDEAANPIQRILVSSDMAGAVAGLALHSTAGQWGDKAASYGTFWRCTSRLWSKLGGAQHVNDRLKQLQPGRLRTIVVIDTRPNPLTAIAALVCAAQLDCSHWSLAVVTTPESANYYRQVLCDDSALKIDIWDDVLPKWAGHKFDVMDYSAFMKSPVMWQKLWDSGSRLILTAQDDGFFVRDAVGSKHGGALQAYDGKAYVGPPWQQGQPILESRVGTQLVGNGGLSLRSVEAGLALTNAHGPGGTGRMIRDLWADRIQLVPEDVAFVQLMVEHRLPVAPRNMAANFASEQVATPGCLGVHKPWPYLHAAAIESLFN